MTDQTNTRAEEVSERRRKRDTTNTGDPSLRRFNVGPEILDTDKFIYRSVADEGVRLMQLTESDDYDFVTAKGEKASKADAAGVLRYQHTVVDGQPKYTYLLRKLKKFADEDRAAKQANIDEVEKARLSKTPADAPDKAYKPK